MDRVRIDKKDRPVCFGWNALAEYENISGKSVFQFASVTDLSIGALRSLVYVGLLYGAKKDKGDTDFTIEDVGNWLTEDSSIATKVIEIFAKSMPDVAKKK